MVSEQCLCLGESAGLSAWSTGYGRSLPFPGGRCCRGELCYALAAQSAGLMRIPAQPTGPSNASRPEGESVVAFRAYKSTRGSDVYIELHTWIILFGKDYLGLGKGGRKYSIRITRMPHIRYGRFDLAQTAALWFLSAMFNSANCQDEVPGQRLRGIPRMYSSR